MSDDPYRAPLDDFIAVRDARAARLKASGDKEGAVEAKQARKPSVPAWAANQVVWQAPEEWDRLQTATLALRQAHETAASADALRRAGREQRDALQACEARASELLVRHGHAATQTVLEKVGHTLLALAQGVSGVTPGRLDRELQPPGFEALAGLTLATPEPRRAAPDDAVAHEAEAQRALADARARLAAVEQRRSAIESQLDEARRACDEARQQLASAEDEATAATKARKLQAESADDERG